MRAKFGNEHFRHLSTSQFYFVWFATLNTVFEFIRASSQAHVVFVVRHGNRAVGMDSHWEVVEDAGNEDKEDDNDALLQKDSKRSWLVCVGAIFLVGIAMGLSNSFGVLFTSWTREFKESRTKIGKNC